MIREDRLTGREGQYAYCRKCFEGPSGCPDMESEKCALCGHSLAIYDRLASYEDTGYSPEELNDMAELFSAIADIPDHRKLALKNCLQQNRRCAEYKELTAYRLTGLSPEAVARFSTEWRKLGKTESIRIDPGVSHHEIILYMTVRARIMENWIPKGKTQDDVDILALDTIDSMFKMMDPDAASKIYNHAKELRQKRDIQEAHL